MANKHSQTSRLPLDFKAEDRRRPGDSAMKLVILFLLACIVLALFWGLTGLLKSDQGSQRLVRSLTLRIGLSIGLFLLLLLGALFGWWRPHQA
ncbi:DUF2909 domain-containing protein [Chromobacterium sp. Rain0013]|nr:DUF2909 domain-containing protein [Chromobacterium sp. Rain0013]